MAILDHRPLGTHGQGDDSSHHGAYHAPPHVPPNAATLESLLTQARAAPPGCRGPLSCCRASLGSSDATAQRENNVPCNGDGSSCHTPRPDAPSPPVEPASGHERAPCSLAVRFANRPNELPLATIVERNSLSTLHSHGSLPSVNCRYGPSQTSNPPSSVPHSHRVSRNIKDTRLHMIQECANHEQDAPEVIVDSAGARVGSAMPCAEVPIIVRGQLRQRSETARLKEGGNDSEGNGLNRLLRGVIQHVRSASHWNESPPFMSPSSADGPVDHTMIAKTVESQDKPHDQQSPIARNSRAAVRTSSAFTDCPALSRGDPADTWADYCERSLNGPETALRDIPTIRHVTPEHPDEQHRPAEHQAPLDQPSVGRSGRHPCPTSTGQKGAHSSVMSGTPIFCARSREDDATRYTFDGTPIYCSTAPSMYEYDRTRNASFCSTTSVSTTYSSTVLGIDLDLHHGIAPTSQRSSTPAWFGASPPDFSWEHKGSTQPQEPSPAAAPRSITSSALPLLLPIAAANGIITHPTSLSFYSPTGNLIQAEPTSNTTAPRSSQYRDVMSYSEPAARPALVPLSTPPQSSMPLPSHLKQKQQHHCHTRSLIVPQLVSSETVKGCGGIVRPERSLTPKSGVRQPFSQSCNLKASSAAALKSRMHAVASCTPFRKRSGRASKRQPTNKTPSTAGPHSTSTHMPLTPKRQKRGVSSRSRTPRMMSGAESAYSAWSPRACFCPPGGSGDAVVVH